MSIQVAKDELNSLTEFQRSMHVIDSPTEQIISNFYRAFIKSTWYSSMPEKLVQSQDADEIVYTANHSYHVLKYSYMTFRLPAIHVKPEYKGRVQVAWCHNVGTNITEEASFKEDNDIYQTMDSVWMDIYFQFYQDSGVDKRKSHNIGVGNTSCLESWSESLPSYPINVDQPWFYGMDRALAFPIFYKGSQARIQHRYKFRRKISDLLRLRFLNKRREWVSSKSYDRYLNVGANHLVEIPQLWGRYAYMSNPELEWYKCNSTRVFYTRDTEICDVENPNVYGSTAEVSLQSKNPCLALFWVAENVDATAENNRSNYTTNTEDLYQGWDPIRTNTLRYGTSAKFDKMESHHFNVGESRKHFPSAPEEALRGGYHGFSYAENSNNFHADIGLVLEGMGAKLVCDIADGNIHSHTDNTQHLEESEDEIADDPTIPMDIMSNVEASSSSMSRSTPPEVHTKSPKFITRARLMVVRKFTITEESEGTYHFQIE